MSKPKFYITTAIVYASQNPHIGNVYEIIATDAIARFKRYLGYDVYFLTGSDEHGQKIQDLATENGKTPKEYVDGIVAGIKDVWKQVNASNDGFIRTTDGEHILAIQKVFKKLYEQGDIYKGEYSGRYCKPCESFWTEAQLADGKCPDCAREVLLANEEAYFFKMSKYQDALIEHIEQNPDFIVPESRKNEMLNTFLKPGLQDLCVSRTSFDWGIPVDFDDKHVVYVWLDALMNYITALGYSPDEKGELYQKYWPADVHIIGKDIVRFHTIYWPIFLMALGEPLPKQVFGHPWFLSDGAKMSKSVGNVIYTEDLIRHFGVDAARYYVLREMPYANDGDITYKNIIARYNADLANTLGNLVNRTVAMVKKYFDGVVPPSLVGRDDPGAPQADINAPWTDIDTNLQQTCESAVQKVRTAAESYHLADALEEIWVIVNRANKYIDETTPWVLAKDEAQKPRLGTVMYNLIESIRIIASLLSSFMPDTAAAIVTQIGGTEPSGAENISWDSVQKFGGGSPAGGTVAGSCVGEAVPLFARIDAEAKLDEIS